MTQSESCQIDAVWRQKKIPVIYRAPGGDPLLVKLPYSDANYDWLRGDNHRKPKWIKQYTCWETPRAWFNDLVNRILRKYRKLYIIQPYRKQEVCAPSCMNAEGHECQCSCMGANHGSQSINNSWFVVSETFATRWHEKELACRLLEAN